MKVFVTGASGFIGRYLCEILLEKGFEVHGTYIQDDDYRRSNNLINRMKFYKCDIRDKDLLKKLLEDIKPDWIFHLAAQAYVRESWRDPNETFDINITGTLNLFESTLELGISPRIISATSSAMYQTVEPPFKEDFPLVPSNPYGLSKIVVDHMGKIFHEQYGMNTICARIFPTTGPGKTGDAPNDFASKLAEIHLGIRDPVIDVETLDQKRDLNHVRDTSNGLIILAEKGTPGESYNICRGEPIQVRSMLETMISFCDKEVKIVYDEKRIKERGKDVPVVWGDSSKIRNLGWTPNSDYNNIFREMFDYWIKEKSK